MARSSVVVVCDWAPPRSVGQRTDRAKALSTKVLDESMCSMVNLDAAHPGHEVDGAGSADARLLGVGPGFLELGLFPGLVLFRAASGELLQNGAVGLIVAVTGFQQHGEPVHHLLDFEAFFFQVRQVALCHGLHFAACSL